jgi:hypothetical protein
MTRDLSQKHRRDLLEAIINCPYVINENTVPVSGADSAPAQVVGTLHLSLEKHRLLVEELNKLIIADDAKHTEDFAMKLCQDGMTRSMGEARRLIDNTKARGMFPEKIKQLYEKQGKEFNDEVP